MAAPKKNAELYAISGDLPLSSCMRIDRIKFYGRMDEERQLRKVCEGTVFGKKPKGLPRTGSKDSVEEVIKRAGHPFCGGQNPLGSNVGAGHGPLCSVVPKIKKNFFTFSIPFFRAF